MGEPKDPKPDFILESCTGGHEGSCTDACAPLAFISRFFGRIAEWWRKKSYECDDRPKHDWSKWERSLGGVFQNRVCRHCDRTTTRSRDI